MDMKAKGKVVPVLNFGTRKTQRETVNGTEVCLISSEV
jgi:hypothetical protein